MRAPKSGDVIAHSYLWWREHEVGEESGRKVRPCVVVVSVNRAPAGKLRVVVVPVTHAPPPAERAAVALPATVKARLKLDSAPSWIVCDEANAFDWPGVDLGKTAQGDVFYGTLPDGLAKRVRAEVLDAIRRGRLRTIPRDE